MGCDTHMRQTALLGSSMSLLSNESIFLKTDIILNLTNIDKNVHNNLENSHPLETINFSQHSVNTEQKCALSS